MTLTVLDDIEQGTPEWHAARRGIITASVIGQLIAISSPAASEVGCPTCQAEAGSPCISSARKVPTPIKTFHDDRTVEAGKLPPVYRPAATDTSRALIMTLAAERITQHTEEAPTSRAMERGTLDEPYARDAYSEQHAPVTETGFMIRDYYGCRVGYSPDGLVGDDGLIEIKSRTQKIQLNTFLWDEVPSGNMAQIQCGMFVSGRPWLDYVSYCGGMPLYVKRVYPDPQWQNVIPAVVAAAETQIRDIIDRYQAATHGLPATERIIHFPELEIVF